MLNYYFFSKLISTLAVFLTAATGCSISMKSGDMNLGGEGQIYTGGFLCAILLLKFENLPPVLALPLAVLLSGLASSLITLISTFLQNKKGISFLLSSFIISSAIIPFIDSLITGPFRTTRGTLLATAFINQEFRFSFYISLVISVILCILFFLFIKKTQTGKQLCIYGTAPEFSRYLGKNITGLTVLSSSLSGFCHGLAGAMAICSSYYACHKGFYSGMGWNALAVAMIAKANPVMLVPGAVLMAVLITSADQYALFNNFNFDISMLIQSAVIFVTAIPFIKRGIFKIRRTK